MKIGLLGGSFNPAHQGHIHISKLALKHLHLDQIWWLPTKHNPLKDLSIYSSYQERCEICEKILSNQSKIFLKKFDEIYTYKLLRQLKKRFPQHQFTWVMGADNIEKFHLWDNFEEIIENIKIAIFSRETFLKKLPKTIFWKFAKKKNCQIFRTKNLDISSTQIRQQLNGK